TEGGDWNIHLGSLIVCWVVQTLIHWLSHQSGHAGGITMGLTHVTVQLRSLGTANGKYEADFLVDTGATDSLAPATEFQAIGVKPVGKTIYELADGSLEEYPFGLVEISFMGEITAGR